MKSLLDFGDRCEPMTKSGTMAFVNCMLAEKSDAGAPPELLESFQYQVMKKRLETGDVPVSDWALAFLATLCDNQAKLVMYAHACVEVYKKTKAEVTMESLSNFFPLGFLTEAALKECWESQKGHSNGMGHVDNLLDTREPWLA